ncbi:MAG: hypothetical protein WD737_13680 [Gemmatimonadota bacterium]
MSKFLNTRGALLVLLGISFHAPLQAQEDAPPLRAFVSAGGGLGSHGTLHASVSLSHATGDYIVRGALGFDLVGFAIFPGESVDPAWSKVLTEGALLYGRRAATGWGWARGALGVGYVHSERHLTPVSPGENPPPVSAFGVAAQAEAAWTPLPWLGLGIAGVGNLNGLRPLGALTLSMHVGRTA